MVIAASAGLYSGRGVQAGASALQQGHPVIRTDRGGQITYHGPGQIIAYLLLDMRRLKLGVRELVRKMEGAVIDLLRIMMFAAEGARMPPVCMWMAQKSLRWG